MLVVHGAPLTLVLSGILITRIVRIVLRGGVTGRTSRSGGTLGRRAAGALQPVKNGNTSYGCRGAEDKSPKGFFKPTSFRHRFGCPGDDDKMQINPFQRFGCLFG